MKHILLIIVLSFFVTVNAIGQKKQLKKAVKLGKNSELFYEAQFKKVYKSVDVEKWLEKENYVLLTFIEGEFARFGGLETGMKAVRFMTEDDFKFKLEEERKRALAIAKRNKAAADAEFRRGVNKWLGIAAAVGAGTKVVSTGAKWLVNRNTSNRASNDYSPKSEQNLVYNIIDNDNQWESADMFGKIKKRSIGFYSVKLKRKTYIEIIRLENGKYTAGSMGGTAKDGIFFKKQFDSESECIKASIEYYISISKR